MVKNKFCLVGIDNDFIDLIEEMPSLFLGYFSENKKFYALINKKKRLGNHNKSSWINIKKKYNPNIILTIDDGKVREKLFRSIYKNNCNNFVFKKSSVSKSTEKKFKFEKGIVIQKYVKIMPNVKIKTGVKINIGTQIHHDCSLDEFVTLGPKALLLGNVKVKKYAYIGANSTIKQNVQIGKGAIIGAGAVVVKDVKNFDVVAGVPAKSIKN